MKTFLRLRSFLALFTLVTLFSLVTANAQQSQPQGGAQSATQDNDTTRGELASFDRFMDGHPEIAEQLRRDPSLVKNEDFVRDHRDLQEYLQQHPGTREEIIENLDYFKVENLWEPARINRSMRGTLRMEIEQKISVVDGRSIPTCLLHPHPIGTSYSSARHGGGPSGLQLLNRHRGTWAQISWTSL